MEIEITYTEQDCTDLGVDPSDIEGELLADIQSALSISLYLEDIKVKVYKND